MGNTKADGISSVALERDVAAVGEAIDRLVRHLDDEPYLAERAAAALLWIGRPAVVPLEAALWGSRSPRERALILVLLAKLGRPARAVLARALLDALTRR